MAARLVDLPLGTPAGLAPDVAGPRVYGMGELLRGYLRARGKHRVIVRIRSPEGPLARSGLARTWLRTGLSAAGPGKTSSASG